MININHLRHKLGKVYRKAGDIKRSYKTKAQNKSKLNNIYGNGSKHVCTFCYYYFQFQICDLSHIDF